MSIKIPRDHRIRWHSNYAFKMCLFFGLMKMYCVIWRHLTTLHVNLDWYATFTLCWHSTIMPTCYSVVSLRVGRFKYRLWQILTILLIHCFIYFKSDGENAMQPIRKEGICWNEKSPRRVKIPSYGKKFESSPNEDRIQNTGSFDRVFLIEGACDDLTKDITKAPCRAILRPPGLHQICALL